MGSINYNLVTGPKSAVSGYRWGGRQSPNGEATDRLQLGGGTVLELGAGGIVVESEHSNMLKTWTLAGVKQDDDGREIQSKSPAPALVHRPPSSIPSHYIVASTSFHNIAGQDG